jgi:hypothetical protein
VSLANVLFIGRLYVCPILRFLLDTTNMTHWIDALHTICARVSQFTVLER